VNRAYQPDRPSWPSFYDELMAVLAELRTENPAGHYSFRSAVVQGLGLRDSFTAKIKSGAYRPTLDRLTHLAGYLGVHPTRFPTYAQRLAQEAIATDPRLIEIFTYLGRMPDRQSYDMAVDSMLRVAKELAPDAIPKTEHKLAYGE
jgi:hypothetical protein